MQLNFVNGCLVGVKNAIIPPIFDYSISYSNVEKSKKMNFN